MPGFNDRMGAHAQEIQRMIIKKESKHTHTGIEL